MYQPNQDSFNNAGFGQPPNARAPQQQQQSRDQHFYGFDGSQQQQPQQQQQQQPVMMNGGVDYRLQSAMQHMNMNQHMPPPPHNQYQWNPNAVEFVPRSQLQMAPELQPYMGAGHGAWMQPASSSQQMGGGGYGGGGYGGQQQQQPQPQPQQQQQQQQQQQYDSYTSAGGGDMPQAMGGNKDTHYFRPQITLPHDLTLVFQGPNGGALMEVQVAAEEIMLKPEQADTWTEAIVSRLSQPECDTDTLHSHAVNLIIEMALCVPSSARHMAGVLVALCERHNKTKNYSVLPQLHTEHEQRSSQLTTNASRLRAFALLLAEVYMQMKSNKGERIKILVTAVIEQIETLLSDENNEQNVKWAATMLQVVDKPLQTDHAQKRREMAVRLAQLHEDHLETFSENGLVHITNILAAITSKEPKQLIADHPEIASANTSRDNNQPSATAAAAEQQPAAGNTPAAKANAVAKAAGRTTESTDELTEDERRFIEENLVGGILHDDSVSSPRTSDDDEMNKDYEKFLAKTGGGGK